jgi:hypothetical protein
MSSMEVAQINGRTVGNSSKFNFIIAINLIIASTRAFSLFTIEFNVPIPLLLLITELLFVSLTLMFGLF